MSATHTTDPAARSWVESANRPDGDFPVQNLPYGIFRPRAGTGGWRAATAIGDSVLDLGGVAEDGLLRGVSTEVRTALGDASLNRLMAQPRAALLALRTELQRLLMDDAPAAGRDPVRARLFAVDDVELALPARIGDYTDFYASIDHATNVGRLLRPDTPLLPNYKHLPVAYHGRASSVVPSGSPVRRPQGQRRSSGDAIVYGPSQRLDFELEMGLFIARGNELGVPIPIDAAGSHLFGLCLLNDWSARDVQAWEYQPLGPFLAKSFATSISPWVVTIDALEPYRAPARSRPDDDPRPLPYLWSDADQTHGAFAIDLEVTLTTAVMRREGLPPRMLSRVRFDTMYWTPAQMIAHHTSNGCNLQPGDLLGSGTVSGPAPGSSGCLLELTSGGRAPLQLASGETRAFLEDDDEVTLRGYCQRPGTARIGFGECRGRVVPGPRP